MNRSCPISKNPTAIEPVFVAKLNLWCASLSVRRASRWKKVLCALSHPFKCPQRPPIQMPLAKRARSSSHTLEQASADVIGLHGGRGEYRIRQPMRGPRGAGVSLLAK
eukprot:426824-Pleurochrysis_carterae.AAC.2